MKWLVIYGVIMCVFLVISIYLNRFVQNKELYSTQFALLACMLGFTSFFGFIYYKQWQFDKNLKAIESYFGNKGIVIRPLEHPIQVQVDSGYYEIEASNGEVINVRAITEEKWNGPDK
ncbi:hypothetical protein P9597_09340 [Aneurinibacillus migulanus]|uniref:hypothetical protein n=1 Tax=Aneurinibacillus migulanus TaxID=47500 RepID=UPI002E1F5AD6|nr:hypothetical protein [Aneurinibacillus migulanus]